MQVYEHRLEPVVELSQLKYRGLLARIACLPRTFVVVLGHFRVIHVEQPWTAILRKVKCVAPDDFVIHGKTPKIGDVGRVGKKLIR